MNRRKIAIIVGALFLALLVWRIAVLLIGGGKVAQRGSGAPPVAVEVVPVMTEPIRELRQFTGSVFPVYQYIVAPKVAGRVTKINKQIGDWVKNGEVIARIDDGEFRQAVLEAEANLRISEANLAETEIQFELSKQDLERVETLQNKGIASSAELDAAVSNYNALESRIKLAKAQVEQRLAALNSARIRQNYTTLTASRPGFVGERFTDEGSMLSANSPVVSVVGIDTVIIRTTVIERIYGQIEIGGSAEVLVDAFPNRVFEGKVVRLAPVLQEASRVAQMEIEVVNDSLLLKPGMFCKVNISLNEKDSAQVVPNEAIVTRDEIKGVFVVREGETTAQWIPVEIGIINSTKTEIASPKLDGKVVVLGQHLLADGSKVMIPKMPSGKAPKDSAIQSGGTE